MTDRPNLFLFYIMQPYSAPKRPFLDVLSILQNVTIEGIAPSDIPKTILYLGWEAMCREGVQFLRKVLPPHLWSCVHTYSLDLFEKETCSPG